MNPQDPQSPSTPSVMPTDQPQPANDLNAQIPASYAPGSDTAVATPAPSMAPIGTSSNGSALQDALAAQLTAPEPDPMAGFAAPTPTAADPIAAPVDAGMATPLGVTPTTAPIDENV